MTMRMQHFSMALAATSIATISQATTLLKDDQSHPIVTAMSTNEKIAIGGLAALTAFSTYTTYTTRKAF